MKNGHWRWPDFIYQYVVCDIKNGHWSWPDFNTFVIYLTLGDFVCKQIKRIDTFGFGCKHYIKGFT